MVMGYTHKPVGYWLSSQTNNVRLFFEEFAKNNNFDPLVPSNWYQTPRIAITETKVLQNKRQNDTNFFWQKASSLLEHFKGSLVKALQHAFPEIGLDASGFDVMSRKQ